MSTYLILTSRSRNRYAGGNSPSPVHAIFFLVVLITFFTLYTIDPNGKKEIKPTVTPQPTATLQSHSICKSKDFSDEWLQRFYKSTDPQVYCKGAK